MTAQSLPLAATRQSRLLGSALIFGGSFWALDFVLIVVNGALTGHLPANADALLPLYMRAGLRLFIVSIPLLVLGLGTLAARLHGRSPKLTIAALPFMLIALVLSSINLATMSGLAGAPAFSDTFMGLSIFATAIATGLLGAGILRAQLLPRPDAVQLLLVGVTTIPILFGTPLPFGPDWATDHLAFVTSGVAYIIVGARAWVGQDT